jgi:hypothetical protein
MRSDSPAADRTARTLLRAAAGALGMWLATSGQQAALAQNSPADTTGAGPAVIAGQIVDTADSPIFYAVVTLEGEHRSATTDSAGHFRLGPVPPGPRILLVRALGYQPATLAVILKPGETLAERYALRRVNVTLSTLTVVGKPEPPGRLAGFYQRKRLGLGLYLTRADIDRRFTNSIPSLFEGKLGIRVLHVAGMDRVVFPRCGRFAVYLDGFVQHGNPNEILNMLNPADLAGIEIYRGPSELPAEFTDNNCAAVVLWTR